MSGEDDLFHQGSALLRDLIQQESQSLSGYQRNRLFQNLGDGTFVDVAAVVGADLVQDGRGVATGDFDGDGDLDLAVSNRNAPQLVILQNDAPRVGNYLAVDLVGTTSNRQGIGTRIALECGGKRQLRTVQLGTGYVSQSSQTAWFGLGSCNQVDSLELRWPSGRREVLTSLEVNRTVTVREGQAADLRAAGEPD